MAQLYSQYTSGLQFTAGTITGSVLGTSGLNPLVDRINSITTADNLITGSIISGTSTQIYANNLYSMSAGNYYSTTTGWQEAGSVVYNNIGSLDSIRIVGQLQANSAGSMMIVVSGTFLAGAGSSNAAHNGGDNFNYYNIDCYTKRTHTNTFSYNFIGRVQDASLPIGENPLVETQTLGTGSNLIIWFRVHTPGSVGFSWNSIHYRYPR